MDKRPAIRCDDRPSFSSHVFSFSRANNFSQPIRLSPHSAVNFLREFTASLGSVCNTDRCNTQLHDQVNGWQILVLHLLFLTDECEDSRICHVTLIMGFVCPSIRLSILHECFEGNVALMKIDPLHCPKRRVQYLLYEVRPLPLKIGIPRNCETDIGCVTSESG